MTDSGRSPKFPVRPSRPKDFVYQGEAEPQTFCLAKSGGAPDHFLLDQVGAEPKVSTLTKVGGAAHFRLTKAGWSAKIII